MNMEPLKILGFAALTLSVRVLTWLSLTGALGVFAYAVYEPTRERTIAAALFAILVYVPALVIEKRSQRAPIRRQQTDSLEEQQYAA